MLTTRYPLERIKDAIQSMRAFREIKPLVLRGAEVSSRYIPGTAERTRRFAVRVPVSCEAEIVAVVEKTTTDVFTAKVALLVPAPMVTLAGTVAAALSLDRETRTPPPGAGPLSVTVPVDDPSGPPTTLVGISVSEERLGGKTVSEAVRVPPL